MVSYGVFIGYYNGLAIQLIPRSPHLFEHLKRYTCAISGSRIGTSYCCLCASCPTENHYGCRRGPNVTKRIVLCCIGCTVDDRLHPYSEVRPVITSDIRRIQALSKSPQFIRTRNCLRLLFRPLVRHATVTGLARHWRQSVAHRAIKLFITDGSPLRSPVHVIRTNCPKIELWGIHTRTG